MPLDDLTKRRLKRALGVVPPRLRQRPVYWRWRRFLAGAQRWPPDRIEAWQSARLRELIRWAVTHTEGYRELYASAGIGPDDIRSVADVRHLPFTTKELFRDNLKSFTLASRNGRYVTTGGSTGIPFGFHELPETTAIESAFMHASWSWTGWTLGQPCAVLRGGFVGSPDRLFDHDPYHRELLLSSYYLAPETVAVYLREMRSRGIRTLQAYPSSFNLLCDLVLEAPADRPEVGLDLVLLGSENVYPWQLEKAARAFPSAKLFAWYGHCEKAIMAPWCERSRSGHAWPFYGVTEVLGPDQRAVAEGGEGELVGTSFHQRLTPFIRYRTMDRAVRGPGACPACGRNFPTLERILGRAHEVIVTRRGRYISMTAINMHDDLFDALRQFQFFQDRPGEVTFHYVAKAGTLPTSEQDRIRRGLERKLGDDVTLSLRPVVEIARTRSGKYRFLDQRLEIQYGDRP